MACAISDPIEKKKIKLKKLKLIVKVPNEP